MERERRCNVAKVSVIGVPYHIDKLYDYLVTPDIADNIQRGSIVSLPFGKSNKKHYAVVHSLRFEENDLPPYLKPIFSLDPEAFLSEHFMKLCEFMKERCLCSFGDAVKCILPTAVFSKLSESYRALPYTSSREKVSMKAIMIYDDVALAGEMSASALIKKYGIEVSDILVSLTELGYLEKCVSVGKKNIKKAEIVHLMIDNDRAVEMIENKELRGLKQVTLIEHLMRHGSTALSDLKAVFGISKPTVTALAAKGIVELEEKEVNRLSLPSRSTQSPLVLSELQQRAYEEIEQLIDSEKPSGALLFGVTGSGKTSVIKKAIDKVLDNGKQVIMLVPEIALTPQAVDVFCSYYGERVALIHSGLSEGERYDAYRRIASGEASICIGTRSAVFAPFDDLGLIVIDEEHEHTYKSDQSPKYHARDIARFRCASSGALMLLASATPSVESFYKAEKGIYKLVSLTERYSDAKLPQTVIYDMRADAIEGSLSPLGTLMKDALQKTLDHNEQSIIFVNRRGHNNYVSCPLCGHVEKCEKCSVSMTYHSYRKNSQNGYLICHYCGQRKELPKICPECANKKLSFMGFGTQLAEEEISTAFPDAAVMRMDADTTSGKHSFDRMLENFRKKKSDILIGTQMVSKGHDFPNVTLVGILLADSMLYLDDYRANERTFSLITQVIGRAGRAEKEGVAIIQTYNPEHPVIKLAASQDYLQFYKNEIAIRESFLFPPFCDIVLITFSSSEEAIFKAVLPKFYKLVTELCKSEFSDVPLVSFGPFEAPVYRVNNMYRMRYVFKCKDNKRTRALFSRVFTEFAKNESNKLTLSLDINPSSL